MFDAQGIVIKKIVAVLHINRNGQSISHLQFNGNLRSYELIYTISGDNFTHFCGKTIHNFPGTIEYLPKGIPNSDYTVDIVENGESIDIVFDTDTSLPQEAYNLYAADNENLRKMFEKISTMWVSGTDNEYYTYRCMGILYEILAEMRQEHSNTTSPDNLKEQLKPSIEYISSHFRESTLECSQLGELCSMSYSYFRRVFTSVYKMPPIKYITRIRINYACELLRVGKYQVSEVASLSGYDNIYYFSRVFRKETGLSPSDYKASQTLEKYNSKHKNKKNTQG